MELKTTKTHLVQLMSIYIGFVFPHLTVLAANTSTITNTQSRIQSFYRITL